MKRQRLLILAVVAALSLAAASCSVGPIAYGVPVSGSSSTKLFPQPVVVQACMPSPGHLKIEFDSTAGVNPERVTYRLAIDDSPNPVYLSGPVGYHWEEIDIHNLNAGNCFGLQIIPECLTPCPAWDASSQTFNYKVSIVP